MRSYFFSIISTLIITIAISVPALHVFAQDDLSPADRKNPLLNNERHREKLVNVVEESTSGDKNKRSKRYMVLVNGKTDQIEYYWSAQEEWTPVGSFTALKDAYLKQQQGQKQDMDRMEQVTVE